MDDYNESAVSDRAAFWKLSHSLSGLDLVTRQESRRIRVISLKIEQFDLGHLISVGIDLRGKVVPGGFVTGFPMD